MTILSDADLVKKKAYISTLMNVATLFSTLDDTSSSENKYIAAKKWATITNEDVEAYGITAADVGKFVALMNQFGNLMSNKPVTTLDGRAAADMMRSR